jgi:hypothetical protein
MALGVNIAIVLSAVTLAAILTPSDPMKIELRKGQQFLFNGSAWETFKTTWWAFGLFFAPIFFGLYALAKSAVTIGGGAMEVSALNALAAWVLVCFFTNVILGVAKPEWHRVSDRGVTPGLVTMVEWDQVAKVYVDGQRAWFFAVGANGFPLIVTPRQGVDGANLLDGFLERHAVARADKLPTTVRTLQLGLLLAATSLAAAGALASEAWDITPWVTLLALGGIAYWGTRKIEKLRGVDLMSQTCVEIETSDEALEREMGELATQARATAEEKFGYDLDGSRASIGRLDRILNQAHKAHSNAPLDDLEAKAKLWGAYLGQVIRAELGGSWELRIWAEDMEYLRTADGHELYPQRWCKTQIERGPTESVAFKFRVICSDAVKDGAFRVAKGGKPVPPPGLPNRIRDLAKSIQGSPETSDDWRRIAASGDRLPVLSDPEGILALKQDGQVVWCGEAGEADQLADPRSARLAYFVAARQHESLGDLGPTQPGTAIECPFCDGSGELGRDVYCNGCDALGWVRIVESSSGTAS